MPAKRRFTRAVLAAASVVAVAGATSPLATASPALPSHRPAPTHRQLAESRAAVAARLAQLQGAERRLGLARGRLDHAQLVAEIAAENYDAAHTKLVTAEQRVAADTVTLRAAAASTTRAQRATARFAIAAYETAGGLSGMALVAPGGPATVIDRLGAEQAVTVGRNLALQKLRAAQIVQTTVTRQAQQAQAAAAQATAAAAKAFDAARAATAEATRQFRQVRQQRIAVQHLLAQARAHAQTLRREHQAALARAAAAAAAAARAEAARLAAAAAASANSTLGASSGSSSGATSTGSSPYANTGGSLGGTVDAATEARAVSAAMSQVGKPYQWAAAGPNSYDCSGLTMWAYGQVGVNLLHYTGDQWVEGAHIPQSQLRPGDLVFFATNTSDPSTIHHVGMYIGNGEMVDAPHTGAYVRTESAFWTGYIGAVRPYRT